MIANESRHAAPEVLTQGGLATMQNLHARGALLGVASGLNDACDRASDRPLPLSFVGQSL